MTSLPNRPDDWEAGLRLPELRLACVARCLGMLCKRLLACACSWCRDNRGAVGLSTISHAPKQASMQLRPSLRPSGMLTGKPNICSCCTLLHFGSCLTSPKRHTMYRYDAYLHFMGEEEGYYICSSQLG